MTDFGLCSLSLPATIFYKIFLPLLALSCLDEEWMSSEEWFSEVFLTFDLGTRTPEDTWHCIELPLGNLKQKTQVSAQVVVRNVGGRAGILSDRQHMPKS